MKSARIAAFAAVLAAAAGVGSTAIAPNAAQNAAKFFRISGKRNTRHPHFHESCAARD